MSSSRTNPSTVTVERTNCFASLSLSFTPTRVGTRSRVISNAIALASILPDPAPSKTALAVKLTPSPSNDALGSATVTDKNRTLLKSTTALACLFHAASLGRPSSSSAVKSLQTARKTYTNPLPSSSPSFP